MAFSDIMQRFMEKTPIPVMAQALLERVLDDHRLDACFERVADKQYTRTLLFSSIFNLMTLVVTKVFPSVNAAYQAEKEDIGVSITSVYNKLNGMEIEIPAALVQDTASELTDIVRKMNGACQPILPGGYRVKMLDGNCIEATQHRLEVLRYTSAGPLPGKSLVVYDPALEMSINVYPCEDGHVQERSLLNRVIQHVEMNDVYVMDRNFCVRNFLFNMVDLNAFFIVRHHKNFPYTLLGEKQYIGEMETGKIYEQWIEVLDDSKNSHKWRCITVHLNKETRDGESEIILLTNLPKSSANAIRIAEIYRKRWRIETMFQELESHLHSEINTLGYPRAALFGFCVALIAYNILAVVKAALRSVHGEEVVSNDVSGYYVAGELGRTHEGMMVAIDPEEWSIFHVMTLSQFVETLLTLANNVQLRKYKKHKRGPKKPIPKRESSKDKPHVSTYKLLKAKNKRSP